MAKVRWLLFLTLIALSHSVPKAFADLAPGSPLLEDPSWMAVPGFLMLGAAIMFAFWVKGRKSTDGANHRKALAIASCACLVLSLVMIAILRIGYAQELKEQEEYSRNRIARLTIKRQQLPSELASQASSALREAHAPGAREAKSREVIALLAEVETLAPEQFSAQSHLERGTAHLYLGQYESALKDFEVAQKQGISCHAGLAEAYLGLKQYKKAVENATVGLTESYSSDFSDPNLVRGLAYHELGRNKEALKDLNEAQRTSPRLVLVPRYRVHAALGHESLALKDLWLAKQWGLPLETADLAYLEKKHGADRDR